MFKATLVSAIAMTVLSAGAALADTQVMPLMSCEGAKLDKICNLKDPGGKHEHGSCQLQFTITDNKVVQQIDKKELLADSMHMKSYKKGEYVPDVDTARFEKDGSLTIPEFRETGLQDPINEKNTLVSRINAYTIVGAAYYLMIENGQVDFKIYEVTSGIQEEATPGDSRREDFYKQELRPKKGGTFTFGKCQILNKISDSDSLSK